MSTKETRQTWNAEGAAPAGLEDNLLEGVAWHLPKGVWADVVMKSYVSLPGQTAPQPRGVVFRLGWELRDGTVRVLEREYDGDGILIEVRSKNCVRGNWIGGRM